MTIGEQQTHLPSSCAQVKFNLAVDAIFAAEALAIDEADIKVEMDMQKDQYKV